MNLTLRSQGKGNDHQLKKPFIVEQIPPCCREEYGEYSY